ncbi:MAG: hypothetical protein U9R05_10025 [Chloroflexota bacterium]|nr:hypothetical protein [Chloroflexota bacterium]
MKPSPKELLEKISSHCYVLSTRYRYARAPHWSEKYSEGQLAALEYIDKLCFHFLQEEKNIPERFRAEITKQMQQNSCLNDSEYKNGLYDALNSVLDELHVEK